MVRRAAARRSVAHLDRKDLRMWLSLYPVIAIPDRIMVPTIRA